MTLSLTTMHSRKFLLIPDTSDHRFLGLPCQRITQGYLSFDGTECRVRKVDDAAFTLTLTQQDGTTRKRYTLYLNKAEFDVLLGMAQPYVLHKRRYTHPSGWVVDFFGTKTCEPIAEYTTASPLTGLNGAGIAFGVDLRREVTNDPAYQNRNIALRVGTAEQSAAGYHLRHIPKGILGEVSKIREELAELEDATIQQVKVLQLVELSDLYGAVVHYAESLGVSVDDLAAMAKVTKRAFANGARG